jgi:hypothetical protein
MADGNVGDRLQVESERAGQPARVGQILEVLGNDATVHYRVRWDDGHETTFFPGGGSATILPKAIKSTGRASREKPDRK